MIVIEFVIAIIAMVLSIATAIVTPLAYPIGWDHFTLPNGFVISFIYNGFFFGVGYILANIISGLIPQRSPWLYYLDGLSSWIAMVSIWGTAALELTLYLMGTRSLVGTPLVVQTSTAAVVLLVGLMIFSIIDVFGIQKLKKKNLLKWFADNPGEAAGKVVPGGEHETTYSKVVVNQDVVIRRRFFMEGPGGQLIPWNNPDPGILEHVEYFVKETPAIPQTPSAPASAH